VRFAIKTWKHDSLWEAWYPLETPKPEKRRTRRLGNHKVSKSAIYLSFWAFLGFFKFCCFFHFSAFDFSLFWFFHFYDFLILLLFVFLWFSCFWCFLHFCHFCRFHVFSLFFMIFQFLQGYLKDKALFWPLLPTIVHSHGKHFGGVNSLCEKWGVFFTHFWWFLLFFGHFWSILSDFSILPLRIVFFLSFFDVKFWSNFMVFYYFWEILTPFLRFWPVFDPPSIPVNKCPFGSQKGP